MKSYRKELWFDIPTRRAFVNITPQVEAALQAERHPGGAGLVNAMHITASVFINDDERGLHARLRGLAGEAGARTSPPTAVPPQPDRRGQRRRPPQAPGHGARGGGGRHRRQARLRPLGADLLRRVRRAAAQAGAGQDHRRIIFPTALRRVSFPGQAFRIATGEFWQVYNHEEPPVEKLRRRYAILSRQPSNTIG